MNETKSISGLHGIDWKREGKDLIMIVVGIIIYALGLTIFILPHHIVVGGMAGFSTLVFYATNQTIPVAVTMYGVNLLLLACGYKYLGKAFVLKTIFGATMMSVIIGVLEGYFTSHPPFIPDPTVSVGIGAVLFGMGIGIYMSHHGTTGGTDIIAAIVSQKSDISLGRVMMIVDMSIVACSFFLPFDGDMEARVQACAQTIIYGWLAILLYSYLADKFVYEGRKTLQFIILSDKWKEISTRITHETGRGVTTWDGEGFWTKQTRHIMIVWGRKTDADAIHAIVKAEDPKAYITTSYVKSVYGNGFDVLKIRKK